MNRDEVIKLLCLICEAAAEAIDNYVNISGEKVDQMPEYVMPTSVFRALSDLSRPVILEANAITILERIGITMDTDTGHKVRKILKSGKIDLVTLSPVANEQDRRAVVFIEFKKWYFDENNNFIRLAALLSSIPGAGFGACVIMRDTKADDRWHADIGNRLPSLIVVAKNVTARTRENKPCCVVGLAALPSAM